jgi:hypothetical protein
MQRLSVVITMLAVLTLVVPAAMVRGQATGPTAAPDADQPLDLAAMLLTPADLAAHGLTGLGFTVPEYRDQVEGFRDDLVALGWQRDYVTRHAVPMESDGGSTLVRTSVESFVAEYRDVAGAAAAFALIESEIEAADEPPAAQDIPSTRTIGDQAEITRDERGRDRGRTAVHLDLTFRVGNLYAGVLLADYIGQEPDLATLEALGETLLAKIDTVRAAGGPGLQMRMLRLDGPGLVTQFDGYSRLAGETIPAYNTTAEETMVTAATLGDATDSYIVVQHLTGGTVDAADDVEFTSFVSRFDSPEVAARWLQDTQARMERAAAFVNVTPVTGAPTLGDESAAFSLTTVDDELRNTGLTYYVRVGRDVTGLRLIADPEASLSAATALLVLAQVECLQSAQACPRIRVPASLVALLIPVTPLLVTNVMT